MAYFGEMGRFNGPFLERPEALGLLTGLMRRLEAQGESNGPFRAPANATGQPMRPMERPHAELQTCTPLPSGHVGRVVGSAARGESGPVRHA